MSSLRHFGQSRTTSCWNPDPRALNDLDPLRSGQLRNYDGPEILVFKAQPSFWLGILWLVEMLTSLGYLGLAVEFAIPNAVQITHADFLGLRLSADDGHLGARP